MSEQVQSTFFSIVKTLELIVEITTGIYVLMVYIVSFAEQEES